MSASNSLPLSMFPSEGDVEVIPEGLGTSNPAFLGSVSGVSDNHSSQVMSLPTQGLDGPNAEGAQWNDDEDDSPSAGFLDPAGEDPNISGPKATQEIQERLAGGMTGKDGGMHAMDQADDYRQWVTLDGYSSAFGSDSCSPQGSFEGLPDTISGIQVFPVVRRA